MRRNCSQKTYLIRFFKFLYSSNYFYWEQFSVKLRSAIIKPEVTYKGGILSPRASLRIGNHRENNQFTLKKLRKCRNNVLLEAAQTCQRMESASILSLKMTQSLGESSGVDEEILEGAKQAHCNLLRPLRARLLWTNVKN